MTRKSDSNERPQGLQEVPWRDPGKLAFFQSEYERLTREGQGMSDDAFFAKKGAENEEFLKHQVEEKQAWNDKIWSTDRDGDGLTARQEVQNKQDQDAARMFGTLAATAGVLALGAHVAEAGVDRAALKNVGTAPSSSITEDQPVPPIDDKKTAKTNPVAAVADAAATSGVVTEAFAPVARGLTGTMVALGIIANVPKVLGVDADASNDPDVSQRAVAGSDIVQRRYSNAFTLETKPSAPRPKGGIFDGGNA